MRNFKSEKIPKSLINSSSPKRHAAEKAGKYPHLLFLPNLEEPSARTEAVFIHQVVVYTSKEGKQFIIVVFTGSGNTWNTQ